MHGAHTHLNKASANAGTAVIFTREATMPRDLMQAYTSAHLTRKNQAAARAHWATLLPLTLQLVQYA